MIKDVPGIINPKGKTSVENFHGLKQVELELMSHQPRYPAYYIEDCRIYNEPTLLD